MLLYNEVLAFALCLAQMSIQKNFKLRDHNDLVTAIFAMQEAVKNLPAPKSLPSGDEIVVTRNMLDNVASDEFIERVAHYSARDYKSLEIPDEMLEAFCNMTGQIEVAPIV